MISRVHIENFKSLVNFDLPPKGHQLGGFTCLIGMNGAGKSTLLQAFDFIAHVATGTVKDWLKNRDWKKSELVSNLGKKNLLIQFDVVMRSKMGQEIAWHARFNSTMLKCTFETIHCNGEIILKLEDGRLALIRADGEARSADEVLFDYEGSIFGKLKLEGIHPGVGEVRSILQSLRSLELLSPQLMRKKARSAQDIGASGEKLSPFLNQLNVGSKTDLLLKLQGFYPHLMKWNVKGYRAGWKILRTQEDYGDRTPVEAGHINDGFLRVIAILAQAYTTHSILLLDEIENGINPAIVERLVDFLV
ncbi:MAG: ATP-binding protein [Limisphaerales bacterium]